MHFLLRIFFQNFLGCSSMKIYQENVMRLKINTSYLLFLFLIAINSVSHAENKPVQKQTNLPASQQHTISTPAKQNNSSVSQSPNPVIKENKDGVYIQRDELQLYSSTIQFLGLFVTVASFLFGGIVAINVFQGRGIIKDAKEDFHAQKQEIDKLILELKKELSDMEKEKNKRYEAIKNFEDFSNRIYEETKSKIEEEAKESLEIFVRNKAEITIIMPYKTQLIEELNKDEPDLNYVYPRLTDIISYCDDKNIIIYNLCRKKFKDNIDIIKVVDRGIEILARKNENSIS